MMISGGGGYRGPKEVSYLFIDGGYLRKAAHKMAEVVFLCDEIPIDFRALSANHTKAFYYDCCSPKKNNESKEGYDLRIAGEKTFFNSIRYLNGYHVFEGVTTGRPGRPRQKQVDVKIAVDMLMHSFRGNMHRATLLTGDMDFKPLVDALVQDGMYVTLWYEESSTSKELIYAADARRPMTVTAMYNYSMPVFKEKYSIPRQLISADKNIDKFTLEETGHGPNGESVELYKSSDEYLIIHPYAEDRSKHFHSYYFDHKFLLRFFDFEFFKVQWQDA